MITGQRNQPTPAQTTYAKDLISKLGYRQGAFKLENMTRKEVSDLIERLRKELEWLK